MSALAHLRRRFRYHAWASRTLAEALVATPAPDALRPFAHTLAAEGLWLLRLNSAPTHGMAVWPALDATECRDEARAVARRYAAYLEGLDDDALGRPVAYRTTQGVAYETAVGDVLEHVLLHAAHHRGQANVALRAAGTAPPALDFVVWVRAGEPPP